MVAASRARVPLSLRESLRFAAAVGTSVAREVFAERDFERVAAEAIVRAPNAGRALAPCANGEVCVDVGEGVTVAASILDVPCPRGTIFVLHGIRDCKQSMRGWGEIFVESGYRTVLVDLRGHGNSSGNSLTYGVREAHDLKVVLDEVERRGLRAGSVGVAGYSYGAGTAIQWAGLDHRVAAVVAVAPFASLPEVVRGYLPFRFSESFVARALEHAGILGGFDPQEASPRRAIAKTLAPMLLVHGRMDARIPPDQAESIFAGRRQGTELVLVDGAGHKSVLTHPVTSFSRRATSWFDEHFAALS